jgi:hypothetical protein
MVPNNKVMMPFGAWFAADFRSGDLIFSSGSCHNKIVLGLNFSE